MKFRQFEFRFFPKIKNKKKKKSRFCDADFPRDIGLDKNFNYSKSGFHGCYDNFAADDTVSAPHLDPVNISAINKYTPQCDDRCSYSCYKTYPLPELKIQVENLCACAECTSSVPQRWLCVNAVNVQQDTPVGTPNTIPRTRTRIKTNPWLPSPRATPAPSPTETVDSILFAGGDSVDSYQNGTGCYRTDGNIGHYTGGNGGLADYSQRQKFAALHGLVQIAELEDDVSDVDVEPADQADNVSDFIHIRGSRQGSAERITVDFVENIDYRNDTKSGSRKRFSFSEFLQYDTDESCCTSPVTDVDILARVEYTLGFDYEERVNELLENSGLPRDETFKSIQELMESGSCVETDSKVDVCDVDGKVIGEGPNALIETGTIDNMFEYSANTNRQVDANEQMCENGKSLYADTAAFQSTLKQNASVTKQPDDIVADESMNLSSISNPDLTCYDEGNMHESIDTGYASVTRETDSLSSAEETDDAYNSDTNDVDLEWDNDPSAESLILDFATKRHVPTQTNAVFKRWRSRSFGKECYCRRRRSRSLADIELSLDEKVTQLREEKLYVQRKIREAIEEEEIRRRQLTIFRSVSIDNRKDMLLRTLQDLKVRLENQSVRLQTSYNTVLTLQQRFSQRKRNQSSIAMTIL